MMATAGKIILVGVEHLVKLGELNPDQIHTPGILLIVLCTFHLS
ncbi:hypothetical protein [Acidocella sp.]